MIFELPLEEAAGARTGITFGVGFKLTAITPPRYLISPAPHGAGAIMLPVHDFGEKRLEIDW